MPEYLQARVAVDEIEKHGFQFDVHIWQSTKKVAAADFLNLGYHPKVPPVLIMNYEAARMPGVLRALRIWAARGKAYLAIDESIQIKGHKTAQTKAIHALAPVLRVYAAPDRAPADPGPARSLGPAAGDRAVPAHQLLRLPRRLLRHGRLGEQGGLAAKNTDELAAFMAPVVFQAKKTDWLPALPRKDSTIRDYKMSDEQQRQYNQMEREFLLEIEEGVITVDVAIAKYAKLAQIQCGFIYDEDRVVHELVPPETIRG